MKLTLVRIYKGENYTIGKLYIDDIYFCETLEDKERKVKIKNETCIPKGIYKIIFNLSNRFKRIMPRLVNVPGFDGILIHSGNTDKDTSGCILVGENKIVGKLINSRLIYKQLFEIIHLEKSLEIEIKDKNK